MKLSCLTSLSVLLLGFVIGCSPSTTTTNDPTNNGGTSGTDNVYHGPKAGSSFAYSMWQNGRDVSDWSITIDSSDVSAYGMTHTMHFQIAPRDGTEMSKRLLANGDIEIWNPTPGTGGFMTGAVVPINRWIRYPMDGTPGRHVLLDTLVGSNTVIKVMDVIGTATRQSSAGSVKTVHYIESDTSRSGGGMNLDQYEIWFAPSYGTFVKAVNLYNGIVDTLTGVEIQ